MRGFFVMVGLLALILFCLEGAMSQELAGRPGARGMSYTIDDILEGVLPDLDQIAADWKAMGGTSIQTYVTWETCERAGDGQWDWSKWDQTAATLQRHGLKWIPFLILGPAYSTPDWFREGEEHVGCVCLEHGITSKIESLWNPFLKARVDRFLATFAERYEATGILESVNLGIQGDFGEAIYSVAGEWTKNVPGEYHNHAGFWCGDEYALADFRDWARRKYGALSLLNQAWGTQYESFETVDYPARGEDLPQVNVGVLNATSQERRRWLDFVTWYREAMTDLSDWWLADARKHFPNTQIYLCTGGDAQPNHGSQFADQCRVAAAHGAGVRITNEGSDFAGNFMHTRWVASAGRYYGAYFGFEPAALENELGAVARIFNATTSGAVQLADKHYNTVKKPTQRVVIEAHLQYLFHAPEPQIHVALWYPNVTLTLENSYLAHWGDAYLLRKLTDLDYVDESLLKAGALAQYPILVIVHGQVMEPADAHRIADWVKAGGRLFVVNVPKLETVEGDALPEQLLFGETPGGRELGKGRVERCASLGELAPRLYATLDELGLPVVEQQYSGQVFASEVEPGRWLLFNAEETPSEARITTAEGAFTVTVPPAEIVDTGEL